MLDAGGVAVPLGTPHQPGLGAVALVSLTRESPVPESHVDDLQALAPQIALTVRNHQLAARTRRTRQTLEGVISSSRMGVLVSDLRGRLSLANHAAARDPGHRPGAAGRPADERAGRPSRIKWRFINPDEYAERVLAVHDDPSRESLDDAETVDGRAIEHSSSPVRDPSGALVGRVDILTDVTPARSALAEARRLAAERAELLEREERRAQEEVALSRAAHMMASALTPADIHEHLLDQAHRLDPRVRQERRPRGRPARPGGARGDARLLRGQTVKRMVFKMGEGVVGGRPGRAAAVRLQRRRGRAARLEPHHRARGHPLVHARAAGAWATASTASSASTAPRCAPSASATCASWASWRATRRARCRTRSSSSRSATSPRRCSRP